MHRLILVRYIKAIRKVGVEQLNFQSLAHPTSYCSVQPLGSLSAATTVLRRYVK